PAIAAREPVGQLSVLHLVHTGALRLRHQSSGRSEREQLHCKARKARDRGVLGRGDVQPVLAERGAEPCVKMRDSRGKHALGPVAALLGRRLASSSIHKQRPAGWAVQRPGHDERQEAHHLERPPWLKTTQLPLALTISWRPRPSLPTPCATLRRNRPLYGRA